MTCSSTALLKSIPACLSRIASQKAGIARNRKPRNVAV
jgi:hypothetical protein